MRNSSLSLIFFFLLLCVGLKADEKKEDWPETMTFLKPKNERPSIMQYRMPKSVPDSNNMDYKMDYKAELFDPKLMNERESSAKPEEDSEKQEISTKEVIEFVKKYRKALCSVNPSGSYEMWIGTTGKGELGIINFFSASVSGEIGLKAIINCPPGEKIEASEGRS